MVRLLDSLRQDLVFVWRSCRRQPAFVLTAIATLTLGIGANTAIFSVLNAVLLRPLPYPEPDRIVMLGTESGVSAAKFNLWRDELTREAVSPATPASPADPASAASAANAAGAASAASAGGSDASPRTGAGDNAQLRQLAAWRVASVNVGADAGAAEAEEVTCVHATADFFRLFGAQLAIGRAFDVTDTSAASVVVLSHGFWQRHFGADVNVIGRRLALNGTPHLIIGVLSDRFDGGTIIGPYWDRPEIWTPLPIDPRSADQANALAAAARLAPDATIASTRAALQRAGADFKRRFPGVMLANDEFGVEPMQAYLTGDVRTPLFVLAGAVCFVLLIACANVANLLLARATARSREMAIRTAIGASRGRLVRQLLTESIALAAIGGAAGLIAGTVAVRAILAVSPGNIPRIGEQAAAVTLDARVVTFTIAITLVTALLFGLLPAWLAARRDSGLIALASHRDAHAGRQGRPRMAAQSVLVIVEMTLAVALLIGAALLIRTMVALYHVDTGFDRQHVQTLRMSLRDPRFARTAGVAQLTEAGVRRLNAVPGVIASSASFGLPVQGYLTLRFTIPGLPLQGPYHAMGSWGVVSPGYFDVFKIPVLRGRAFTDADTLGTPPVAIISAALARRFFPDPNDDALTHRIVLGRGLGAPFDEESVRQIIGVVGDVRERDLTRDLQPTVYVPISQQPNGLTALNASLGFMNWSVRTGSATPGAALMADALKQASGGLPVSHVRTMDDLMSTATARQNFNMVMLTTFACSAALLAAVGIYGLMSYALHQRTREFGIRLALGADPRAVRRLILRDGLQLIVTGTSLGLVIAFGLTRVLAFSGSLFAVSPHDPFVFVSVPLLLIAIAFLATWPPGRRASRIDPVIALRGE